MKLDITKSATIRVQQIIEHINSMNMVEKELKNIASMINDEIRKEEEREREEERKRLKENIRGKAEDTVAAGIAATSNFWNRTKNAARAFKGGSEE